MAVEKKCVDICDEIIDCSACSDEDCENVCNELEDRCLAICTEVLG